MTCRSAKEGGEHEKKTEDRASDPPRGPRPRILAFANGTKKKAARDSCMVEIKNVDQTIERVAWLGDSGSHVHVCNNLGAFWEIERKLEPLKLRHLVGEVEFFMVGIVMLECEDKEGEKVVFELKEVAYIPESHANLLSLPKLRTAKYRVEQPPKIGIGWIRSAKGRYIGSMEEDSDGRSVLKCKTLSPPSKPIPLKLSKPPVT